MGIVAGLFERRAGLGQKFHVSQTPPGYVDQWGGGWETPAGTRVTADGSLQVTAVFACTRILAETQAALPLLTYRRLGPGRGRARAEEHPLYPVLHSLPNPEMTSFNLRETLQGHLVLRGNCYAEIERDRGGRVVALWPLNPDRMEDIKRENGRLVYFYRVPDKLGGQVKQLDQSLVLHVRSLGSNGIVGYSPIRLAMNAVGLALATEEFGGRFFGNGARPGGVLEHPQSLSDKAYDRLEKKFSNRHQGLENAQRLAILEEGMKYHEIGVKPDEAQFLETRKFQVTEIARLFRVPPHMLADLDRATFSNIEHLSIEFVTFTLYPWLVNWEQEISRSLLTPAERKTYFAEHLVSGLLRGDIKSRYEAYHVARTDGWMSANDIREVENQNPIEGGDVYLVPLNMIPADQVGQVQPVEPSNGGAGQRALPGRVETAVSESSEERGTRAGRKRHKLISAYTSLYRKTAERVLRREAADIRAAARKYLGSRAGGTAPEQRDLGQFNVWLSEYYDQHELFVQDTFRPVNEAYGLVVGESAQTEIDSEDDLQDIMPTFLESYLLMFASRHVGTSVNQVRDRLQQALAEEQNPVEALNELMDHWLDARTSETAQEESVRLNNATAVQVYKRGGIVRLRWLSFGESCPYCNHLNGKVVGIEENFIAAGTDFKPSGADRPLRTASNIGHGPAHGGCDCMVVAA